MTSLARVVPVEFDAVGYPDDMPRAEWIEWSDHKSFEDGAWQDGETVQQEKPVLVVTLGFVIKETDYFLNVVGTWESSGQMSGGHSLLKSAIKSRRPIEVL